MDKRRVVVIGIGVVIFIGNDVEIFWENVKKGVNGVVKMIRFNLDDFLVKIVVELKDFDVEKYLEKKEVCKMDCFMYYVIVSVEMVV